MAGIKEYLWTGGESEQVDRVQSLDGEDTRLLSHEIHDSNGKAIPPSDSLVISCNSSRTNHIILLKDFGYALGHLKCSRCSIVLCMLFWEKGVEPVKYLPLTGLGAKIHDATLPCGATAHCIPILQAWLTTPGLTEEAFWDFSTVLNCTSENCKYCFRFSQGLKRLLWKTDSHKTHHLGHLPHLPCARSTTGWNSFSYTANIPVCCEAVCFPLHFQSRIPNEIQGRSCAC